MVPSSCLTLGSANYLVIVFGDGAADVATYITYDPHFLLYIDHIFSILFHSHCYGGKCNKMKPYLAALVLAIREVWAVCLSSTITDYFGRRCESWSRNSPNVFEFVDSSTCQCSLPSIPTQPYMVVLWPLCGSSILRGSSGDCQQLLLLPVYQKWQLVSSKKYIGLFSLLYLAYSMMKSFLIIFKSYSVHDGCGNFITRGSFRMLCFL